MSGSLGWRLPAALAAVYVVWSSTYLAMKIAVADVPPFLMASVRHLIAGVVLVGVARIRRRPWPSGAQWRNAVPIGVLYFVGGNALIGVAERDVGSGLAAVVVATMPLWVVVVG